MTQLEMTQLEIVYTDGNSEYYRECDAIIDEDEITIKQGRKITMIQRSNVRKLVTEVDDE